VLVKTIQRVQSWEKGKRVPFIVKMQASVQTIY
jgi:hypothetical protein